MLRAMPAIVAAGSLVGYELYRLGDLALSADAAIAALLAFVTALCAIGLMMAWLRRSSFTPFVLYRVALGGFVLWWDYYGPGF